MENSIIIRVVGNLFYLFYIWRNKYLFLYSCLQRLDCHDCLQVANYMLICHLCQMRDRCTYNYLLARYLVMTPATSIRREIVRIYMRSIKLTLANCFLTAYLYFCTFFFTYYCIYISLHNSVRFSSYVWKSIIYLHGSRHEKCLNRPPVLK